MKTKFQKFQATRKFYTNLADNPECASHDIEGPGFTYGPEGSTLHIQIDQNDGQFYAVIENTCPSSFELANVEMYLFDWCSMEMPEFVSGL